jgi:class 3 adenylate cyclase/tetratricopeptide (TPR) repeat protein
VTDPDTTAGATGMDADDDLVAASELLHPYVPRLVRRWLVDEPETRWRSVDGTLVFVDISGFTRLSERLAEHGRIGAEELTEAIGTCFAGLLAVAYRVGGTLLKFGGDALLVLFTGDGHATRGCRAAVGMRRELHRIGRIDSSAGRVRLAMSVGVHTGHVDLFLVGRSHRELLITGSAATQAARMEAVADAGEIVVSPATADRIPTAVLGEAKGPGWLLRTAPSTPDAPVVPGTSWTDAHLLTCIPRGLREHLLAGHQEPEHRLVTIAFLRFSGIEAMLERDGPAAALDALDQLVGGVQDAVDQHGVTFLASDIDADGGKLILTAGAPSSGGNDEERMLLALQQVVAAGPPLPLEVGVNVGHVFAGDIGPAYRRTYTVMGDAVNLAARVMSRAEPGDVLAADEVLAASSTAFETRALAPFMVKGRSAPVSASTVGRVLGTRSIHVRTELPFVGRAAELDAFERARDAARAGTGRLVEIVGEVGIGKSRLLAACRDRAAELSVQALVCELHRATTPYGAARRLFRGLLGISNEAGADEAGQALLTVVRAELPELVEWAPLLAVVFGAEVEATATTASLDGSYLRPRLHDAVTRFLGWRWPGPTLLTVEDLQWMDEASLDVLRSIATQARQQPWLICTTVRDDPDRAPLLDDVVTLVLAPLDAEATSSLVAAATSTAPLPRHELALLAERSAGNPLFLQELVTSAIADGGVAELPDSVESLVTARIDRLPPEERRVLRFVSVLGQRFPRELAAAVLPDPVPGGRGVWDRLGDFIEQDGDAVRFRHAVIRDVAYGGLRYGLRRELHAKAGDVIAASARGRREQQAGLLAVHFLHAQRYDEAWRYALIAAEHARALYANAEAAAFLERALAAARKLEGLDATEVAAVYERLGDVRDHMGIYREAAAAYRQARRLHPPDPVTEARLILKQAQQHGWLNRYSQALRWIRRGLRLLEDLDGTDAARQRAQLEAWYARFCEEEGRHRLALRWCRRTIATAQAAGEREALAHAYRIYDRARANLGQLDELRYSEDALRIYEELDDLRGQAVVANNLAAFAYFHGDWSRTREHLERALGICRRSGDENGVAMATYNLGHLLCDQGRLEEASELLGIALRIDQAGGHRVGVATAQRELALIAARTGRLDDAHALLDDALDAFQDVGAEVEVIDTLAVRAESHLHAGEPASALTAVDEALRRSDALGGVSAQAPFVHRLRGYALLQRGDPAAARDALDESLAAGRAREMDYEVALTLRALGVLADAAPAAAADLSSDAMTTEAQAIFDRLGVVRPPGIDTTIVPGGTDA